MLISVLRAACFPLMLAPLVSDAGVFRCQVGEKTIYQQVPCTGTGARKEGNSWNDYSADDAVRERRLMEEKARAEKIEALESELAREQARLDVARMYAKRNALDGLKLGMNATELLSRQEWGYPDRRDFTQSVEGRADVWVYNADPSGNSFVVVTIFNGVVIRYMQSQ